MQRGVTRQLDAEFEAGAELPARTRPTGSTAAGPGIDAGRGRPAPGRHRRGAGHAAQGRREASATFPTTFTAHKTIDRLLKTRRKMIDDGAGIDWAMAEALAFGTLLNEGTPVRLSGQDVRARHLLPAPRRAGRSGNREEIHAAQPHGQGTGALRSHQLHAVGRGGAGLRIRLQPRRAQWRWCCGKPSSAISPTARR